MSMFQHIQPVLQYVAFDFQFVLKLSVFTSNQCKNFIIMTKLHEPQAFNVAEDVNCKTTLLLSMHRAIQ